MHYALYTGVSLTCIMHYIQVCRWQTVACGVRKYVNFCSRKRMWRWPFTHPRQQRLRNSVCVLFWLLLYVLVTVTWTRKDWIIWNGRNISWPLHFCQPSAAKIQPRRSTLCLYRLQRNKSALFLLCWFYLAVLIGRAMAFARLSVHRSHISSQFDKKKLQKAKKWSEHSPGQELPFCQLSDQKVKVEA